MALVSLPPQSYYIQLFTAVSKRVLAGAIQNQGQKTGGSQ